jgi:SAM-dependent methyltransferase
MPINKPEILKIETSLLQKTKETTIQVSTDDQFNKIYPPSIQLLAQRHWTPLEVAIKAADFLAVENNVNILDIGSGVGKFCLAAANHKPNTLFTGIEQRLSLIRHAEAAKELLQVKNAKFINGNFTQIDFENYDHFYFFNAFFENLTGTNRIDNSIDYSSELYNYYNRYLYKQLQRKPAGTRVAAYYSLDDEMPPDYHIVGVDMENLLKFWIKV